MSADLPPNATIRLRRRVLRERAVGLVALLALVYLGGRLGVFFALALLLELPGVLADSLLALAQGAVLAALGLLALVAWHALMTPALRQSAPSFDRVVDGLRRILSLLTGWRAAAAAPGPGTLEGKTEPPWRLYVIAALCIGATIAAVALLPDWTARLLAAVLVPLAGIAASLLGAEPGGRRAERAILLAVLALALMLTAILALQRVQTRAAQRNAEGLKAAIAASGMTDQSPTALQQALRLALAAQSDNPSWLAAQSLRHAIDALPLRVGTLSAQRTTSSGGREEVKLGHLAVSRTGAYLAGAGDDSVRIWANGSPREIGALQCYGARLVHFSADASLLVAMCRSGAELRVWDVAGRRERFSVAVDDATGVRIGPRSGFIAAIGKECVHLFAAASPDRLARHCAGPAIVDVTFDQREQFLVVARKASAVSREFIDLTAPDKVNGPLAVAWAPTTAGFAVITAPATIDVYDWQSGAARARITHHGVAQAFVSAAGDRLVTAAQARGPGDSASFDEIKIWQLPDGRELASLRDAGGQAGQIQVSERGTSVVWQSGYSTASAWALDRPEQRTTLAGVQAAALRGDGRLLATAASSLEGRAAAGTLWSLGGLDTTMPIELAGPTAPQLRLAPHAGKIVATYPDDVALIDPMGAVVVSIAQAKAKHVAIDANARHAATVGEREDLALWSLAPTATKLDVKLPSVDARCSMLFAPDGRWVAVETCKGQLLALRAADAQVLVDAPRPGGALDQLVVSSDGRLLASNDRETITVFDVDRGQPVLTIPVPQWQGRGEATIAFRPGTHQLINAYTEQPSGPQEAFAFMLQKRERVAVWEVDQRRVSARFAPAKVSRPDRLVFDRAGRRLALTNTLNGPIEIWDIARRVLESRIEEGPTSTIAFTEDSRYLLTLSRAGLARLWSVDGAAEVDRLAAPDVRDAILVGPFAITLGASGLRRWVVDPSALRAAGCSRLTAPGRGGATADAACQALRVER